MTAEDAPGRSSSMPMMMRVSQRLVERAFHNGLRNTFRTWFPDGGAPRAQLALRYGNNFVITPEGGLSGLLREDIIEVADYDPARNSLLYLGKQAPDRYAPLFWFIFRTFPEVNTILLLPEGSWSEAVLGDVDALQADLRYINPGSCLAAMPMLKGKGAVKLGSGEAVFLLKDLKETENILKKLALSPA